MTKKKKNHEQGKITKTFREIVQCISQRKGQNVIVDTVIKISTSIGKQVRDEQFNKKRNLD